MAVSETETGASPLPWLAVVAVVYAAMHHVGVGMAWLGSVGETRWADWIDLLTPYAFLLSAAMALRAGHVAMRVWAVFLVGAIAYTEGHGIHLAANSVGNAQPPSDVVHLWDEVVGHYVWYSGVFLVFGALAAGLARLDPPRGVIPYVLALLVGVTVATNSLEGGTAVFGIVVAVGFAVWGWATRTGLGRLLAVVFAAALLLMTGYGVWQGGFPEPSELGWI